MDVLEGLEENPLDQDQLDWVNFFDQFPEFEVNDFFQEQEEEENSPPVASTDCHSPDPLLSEIENLLMSDAGDAVPVTPSSDSDYDKLLAEILVEPCPESEDCSVPSEKDRIDLPATPDEASHEPMSKKQIRQMRNRDAAVRSRERKKSYVKDLEMKSRYYEGEYRRLWHLLQCCYAENHALRLCLQSRGGAFGASMTTQESAVLLLESLLLGSLLWFIGIMCQLSLPLVLLLTAVLPRENMEQKELRKVAPKEPESKIPEYFLMKSFVKSRRCRASRTKMKFDYLLFYNF